MNDLRAPFPYAGGKSKWAAEVWRRLGSDNAVYLEPFCGSAAILLANPRPCRREVICDLSPHIVNFWRAVKHDPEAVAFHADYPTIHADLHARNIYLAKWAVDNDQRVFDDAQWFDAKAAGWWAWGKSHWIGAMYPSVAIADDGRLYDYRREGPEAGCSDGAGKVPYVKGMGGQGVGRMDLKADDKVPSVRHAAGGMGIQMQRTDLKADDKVPMVNHAGGGQGCSRNRETMRATDGIPQVATDCVAGGNGVQMQKAALKAQDGIPRQPGGQGSFGARGVARQRTDMQGAPLDGSRLLPWMAKLSDRLSNVIVLRRSWESGVTNPMTTYRAKCAVFLDPPYLTAERSSDMYGSDRQGTSDDAARASYKWAVEHGGDPRFRIAYCCHEGDFPVPEGWAALTRGFSGIRRPDRQHRQDQVMFSPHCEGAEQADLFA